jgi:hypothetical protein
MVDNIETIPDRRSELGVVVPAKRGLIGLDAVNLEKLPITEKEALLKQAASEMLEAGADFVAEDLSACDPLLTEIQTSLGDRASRDRISRREEFRGK